MADCIIAKGIEFSRSYNNYAVYGYDIDALISDIESQLAADYPGVSWRPHAGEISAQGNSIRAVRAQYPAEEMKSWFRSAWEKAVSKQRQSMTEAEINRVDARSNAPDINALFRSMADPMTVREIAEASGLSHRKLAERFGIPYRTMEDWCAGRRDCAPYIRRMMLECLNIPVDPE